jgi:alkanesulfonate monooxygenase SsuD/methylene tetrahydromethanopterin reductase-like flavin-dependent oxidoreductase (luciferase family)
MAMAAATAQAASKGRFRLGLGPSHQPLVAGAYGLSYERPVRYMAEYVTAVRELLQQGSTKLQGEMLRVRAPLMVEDGAGVPVLMSALGEQMCRTAGRVADGVLPWLAPVDYVRDLIVPEVAAGASKAGRPAPPIVVENACVLSEDAGAVLEAVRSQLGFYLAMPAYRALFERAGVPDLENAATAGWTADMVDAVLPWGSPERIASWVEDCFAAGADEVVLSPVGVGPDTERSFERALEVLGELARSGA